MKRPFALVLLFAATALYAQKPSTTPPQAAPSQAKPAATDQQTPVQKNDAALVPNTPQRPIDRAAAYYHFTQAHIYEELVAMYGRSDYMARAVEEYKLAIENDPTSQYLTASLADLYARAGRIRDAVTEAQEIIKKDPNNLEARKLLGRIYLRSLGDTNAGTQSQEMLRLAIEQYEQIVRLEPKSVDDRLLLGRLYRANNDLTKAEQTFKTAVDLDPTNEDAVTTLAYLYNDEGDVNRAIQTLKLLPDAARSGKVYQALGYSYEQQHDYKHAIESYRKALDEDKDNLDAMRGLAQNLLNDGQTQEALKQYSAIAEGDPQDVETQIHIAEIYRRDGKFDQALDSLKKAEGIAPEAIQIPYNRALIFEAQGRYDEAIQTLNTLLTKSAKPNGNYSPADRNNRAVFLERLGMIYRESGKTQAAIDTFRKVLDLGQENAARGYDQIIETYRETKNWNQATAVAQEAVGKLPQNRDLKLVLAGQLADQGKGDDAIAQVKSMLKGGPDDREVWIALSQIQSRLKRWPEAEESITKAMSLSTKQEEKDYVNFLLGSMYERQKKYEQAEETFKKVLANDNSNATALNYLGYMLADRGVRLDEALGYIKRAVELEPQNGAYLDSLGWVYYKMGNYDLAEANLRKASEKIGNDGTVQDHLGDLYSKTGRLRLAATHWERALNEWNKTVAAEVDQNDVAKTQKKLESAKVKLAKEEGGAQKATKQ